MKTRIVMLLMLVAFAGGCVESLYPVYDTRTQVFEKALVGKWVQGKSSWSFAPRDERSYQLTIVDENGKQLPFVAHLARFEDLLVLDLYPEKKAGAAESGTFHDYHFLPVHSIYVVRKLDDVLELGVVNVKELREFLEANPGETGHAVVEERLLLTAPTPALQKFLVKHQDKFSGKVELTRS